MKIFKTIMLLSVVTLIAQNALAQDYKDCADAFQLCGESPFNIAVEPGIGMEEVGINTSCLFGEFNSTWISWSILSGGVLTFNLVPNNEFDDLDFLVFKLNNENDCTDKELIRCMASGQNVGTPQSEWERCVGPTGLLVGELDTIESFGCSSLDNNYLAPIEAIQGDHYLLMVNDNSVDELGFEISFGGDSELDCISVQTKEFVVNEKINFDIIPSVSVGEIKIEFDRNVHNLGARLLVYDMNGSLVYRIDEVKETAYDVDLSGMENGIYLVSVQHKQSIFSSKFVLAK